MAATTRSVKPGLWLEYQERHGKRAARVKRQQARTVMLLSVCGDSEAVCGGVIGEADERLKRVLG